MTNKYTSKLHCNGYYVNDFLIYWGLSRKTYERMSVRQQDKLNKMIESMGINYSFFVDLKNSFSHKNGVLYKHGVLCNADDGRGYICATFKGKKIKAHRVIFFLENGYLPECVDHIDGNPRNNKPSNLRDGGLGVNARNTKIRKDNTSGVKGVSFDSGAGKWRAQIKVNGISKYIGIYKEKSEAEEAVKTAREILHGDHFNHG